MSSGPGAPGAGSSGSGGFNWNMVGALAGVIGVAVTVYALVIQPSPPGPGPVPLPPTSSPSTAVTADPEPSSTGPTRAEPSPDPTRDAPPDDEVDPVDDGGNRNGGGSVPPDDTSGPTLAASAQVVDFGDALAVSGSGFRPGAGLQLRWVRVDGISYELARELVADSGGAFETGGPMGGQGFCGEGAVMAFAETGSSIEVPDVDEAIAGVAVSVRC